MNVLVEFLCGDRQQVKERDIRRTVARCGKCGCTRAIHHVIVMEWASRCYDCNFKHWWGDAEELAKDDARRHSNSRPKHRASHFKASRPTSRKMQELLEEKLR